MSHVGQKNAKKCHILFVWPLSSTEKGASKLFKNNTGGSKKVGKISFKILFDLIMKLIEIVYAAC